MIELIIYCIIGCIWIILSAVLYSYNRKLIRQLKQRNEQHRILSECHDGLIKSYLELKELKEKKTKKKEKLISNLMFENESLQENNELLMSWIYYLEDQLKKEKNEYSNPFTE